MSPRLMRDVYEADADLGLDLAGRPAAEVVGVEGVTKRNVEANAIAPEGKVWLKSLDNVMQVVGAPEEPAEAAPVEEPTPVDETGQDEPPAPE